LDPIDHKKAEEHIQTSEFVFEQRTTQVQHIQPIFDLFAPSRRDLYMVFRWDLLQDHPSKVQSKFLHYAGLAIGNLENGVRRDISPHTLGRWEYVDERHNFLPGGGAFASFQKCAKDPTA